MTNPPSREDLYQEFEDELRGMLAAAFAEAELQNPARERSPQDYAKLALAQIKAWKRARRLLDRLHDFYTAKPPNGKDGRHGVTNGTAPRSN